MNLKFLIDSTITERGPGDPWVLCSSVAVWEIAMGVKSQQQRVGQGQKNQVYKTLHYISNGTTMVMK